MGMFYYTNSSETPSVIPQRGISDILTIFMSINEHPLLTLEQVQNSKISPAPILPLSRRSG